MMIKKVMVKTYITNTCMIGEHQTAHFVRCLQIWWLSRQGHLDARRSPRNEPRQFPFPDALQTLMNLGRINVALNNIQNGNVATAFGRRGYHNVFWLQFWSISDDNKHHQDCYPPAVIDALRRGP